MLRSLVTLAAALAFLGAAAGPTLGAATTTVYSSGDLAVAIPDGGVLEQPLSVPDGGPIADVDVRVRLAHPNDGDLELTIVGADGTTVLLAKRRGGRGDDYGTGAESCAGKPTVFDDEAPWTSDPIHLATPPFAGAHWGEEFLGAFDGLEGKGDWKLRVRDARAGNAGTLLCFELVVTRVEPAVKVAESAGVRAELSYREYDWNFTHVTLTIARAGETLLEEKIARACANCFALVARDRPLAVRDLDGDGEPEALLDLYTGGAHCCFYSRIYRYDPAANGYDPSVHWWRNVGYRLADLDGDGRPELRSWDDRFAYVFSCYACSWFPPQIWRYRDGRLVDVTRSYPALVRADAQRAWRSYLRLRDRRGYDVRAVLAAYAADRALLGELGAAWKQLLAAERRGDLEEPGTGTDSIWPEGEEYLAALRRFLRETCYLR